MQWHVEGLKPPGYRSEHPDFNENDKLFRRSCDDPQLKYTDGLQQVRDHLALNKSTLTLFHEVTTIREGCKLIGFVQNECRKDNKCN